MRALPLTACLLAATMAGSPLAFAATTTDTFTGFTMDFVNIGNAGNADDGGLPYGGVAYNYRMGTHEVSRGMIAAYNTSSGGPALTMSDMTPYGGNGMNKPATGVSWNEAARFVNWLNTSRGYSPAYKFTTVGANDNVGLWTGVDAGFDAGNPFRNSHAHYFLPTEDEWYKAAYYDPTSSTYFDFATGSNSEPTTTSGGTSAGTAVYRDMATLDPPLGPADITNAGGLSPYGTMAQNGNAWEWSESRYAPPNELGNSRVLRGGDWGNPFNSLRSSNRLPNNPTSKELTDGFRVASIPEPSAVLILVLGGMTLALRRCRT